MSHEKQWDSSHESDPSNAGANEPSSGGPKPDSFMEWAHRVHEHLFGEHSQRRKMHRMHHHAMFHGFGGHGEHGHGHGHGHGGEGGFGGHGGGPFGVRRPLRFLARHLDLSEDQTAQLAAVLDDLKTQHAQMGVDHRRVVAAFADLMAGETFDAEAAQRASKAKVTSFEALQGEHLRTLEKVYTMLNPEQRKKLSTLMRSHGLFF